MVSACRGLIQFCHTAAWHSTRSRWLHTDRWRESVRQRQCPFADFGGVADKRTDQVQVVGGQNGGLVQVNSLASDANVASTTATDAEAGAYRDSTRALVPSNLAALRAAANGLATLNSSALLPTAQLPTIPPSGDRTTKNPKQNHQGNHPSEHDQGIELRAACFEIFEAFATAKR